MHKNDQTAWLCMPRISVYSYEAFSSFVHGIMETACGISYVRDGDAAPGCMYRYIQRARTNQNSTSVERCLLPVTDQNSTGKPFVLEMNKAVTKEGRAEQVTAARIYHNQYSFISLPLCGDHQSMAAALPWPWPEDATAHTPSFQQVFFTGYTAP